MLCISVYPIALSTSHHCAAHWLVTCVCVHADTTLEHGASYQAVGLSYGEDSAAPEVSEAVPLFDPAFDVPPEHQHAMRDMTEQQHKVIQSLIN